MTDTGIDRLPDDPHLAGTGADPIPAPTTTTAATQRLNVSLLVPRPGPRYEDLVETAGSDRTLSEIPPEKVSPDKTVLDRTVVETLLAAAYTVPTEQARADGTSSWDATTPVVVTVSAVGVTGTGGTYGRAGLGGYAISAFDITLWDLKAWLPGCALSTLWGGSVRAPIYASGGFTTSTTTQLDQQLDSWVDDAAIPRTKFKIGAARGAQTDRDVARTRQASRRLHRVAPHRRSRRPPPGGLAHGAPNLHAHVGVSTPNLRHREYSSDHARIERFLFDHLSTRPAVS